ncbi:MAG: hypothetical protein ACRBF0_12100 [Calditrichia bacterium]
MTTRLITTLIAFSLFFSCAKSTIVVMPDYKNKQLPSPELAIIVLEDEPTILNDGDLEDDLGSGPADSVFVEYFAQLFPDKLKHYSKFRKVIFARSLPTGEMKKKTFKLNSRKKIDISIPKDGTTVQFDSLTPGVILFIDAFKTKRVIINIPGTMNADGTWSGGSNSDELHYIVDFALWDNTAGAMISYGEAIGQNGVFGAMTYKTWNKALNSLAAAIMEKTPFYREQFAAPLNTNAADPKEKTEPLKEKN